ncbi:MAG: hypothetical protein LBL75_03150 [Rickettsiales bacterium]|jgi:ATP-dependent exoDNAse (exonuclease V) beta subunit|nr:hypothetical protein [Rickettsiales bacterium]
MSKLTEFLQKKESEKFAMNTGKKIHHELQFLQLTDDTKVAKKIRDNEFLSQFWEPGSRAEVPISGFVNGHFYSKRIDRMVVLDKDILFFDYKTDTTRIRREDYKKTIEIYAKLLKSAYPDYNIQGYILWLHDWGLENII